jgi:glycosyltransferase involved in cell wall biosynthesis
MNAPLWHFPRTLSLSVVIPTRGDEARVADAVARALELADEVIVADAASADDTALVARRAGARVVVTPAGRAAQLHAGATAARGDVLLFLDPDAVLDPDAPQAIRVALEAGDVVGGTCRLRYEPGTALARLASWAADLERRALGAFSPVGAIFVRRADYTALGGFAERAAFEGTDFLRRMRARGRAVYLRDVTVRESARRFRRAPALTLALWAVLQGLHAVGVPLRGLLAPR